MTRRLLYHLFWNFYDYLGSYLLVGGASFLGFLCLFTVGAVGVRTLPPGILQALLGLVLLLLLFLFTVSIAAGLFAFATRAAMDEAARLPHFRSGLRALWRPYLKVSGVLVLAVIVAASNVWFYLHLGAAAASAAGRMSFAAVAMVFFWILLGLLAYALCALAVPARFPGSLDLRDVLRRGMLLFAVAPGLWAAVAVMFVLIAAFCFLSVVGTIFLLPFLASLTTTALDIVVRLIDDLGRARTELGDGKTVGAYRRRALELGWEWEHRQPRRSFRELIKPWET